MPGLVGIVSRKTFDHCDRTLRIMLASIQHEKFYSSGMYDNPSMSVYVGWNCLSNSDCDCLPATNQAKDVVLFLIGEVFDNGDRIASSGGGSGNKIARALIRLYEKCGEKFFDNLNGCYCGLLLDTVRGTAFLFNDRYGMYRLFVHEAKDGFYFSSEGKALLAALPQLREFDPKGVGEFLTCGCTLASRSLYKGVNVLPGGALWTVENGEIKKKGRYFNRKDWLGQERLDQKRFLQVAVDSFGGLVNRYTEGFSPVGISLTGGLDSRMIMACLPKLPGEFPCYTFGSMYRDTFDVQTARQVAKACGQPHHELVLGEAFLNDFPRYLERAIFISDGYLGMSGAAELYVNSLARHLSPVRLTGNYGGELLRGDRAFKHKFPKGRFISSELQPFLHEAQMTFRELEDTDPVTFALFRQAPSQGYGRLAVERSQVVLRSPFMDNDLVKMVYQAPPQLLKGDDFCVIIVSRFNPDLLKIPTDQGFLGAGSQLGGLKRRIYRRILIKAEYLVSHGMPNWMAAITRFGIRNIIETTVLGSDKFQHFHTWSHKYLGEYIRDVISSDRIDIGGLFIKRQIENMIRDHVSGKSNFINEIDKILTLFLASQTFFKEQSE